MMQHDFILVDRSGSMSNKWDETLEAINGYVAGLKANDVQTEVTVVAFDTFGESSGYFNIGGDETAFEIIRESVSPTEWNAIDPRECWPRGGTPLNDAVGRIVDIAKRGKNGEQFEKVVIVVVTDGGENASKEYTHEQAKAALQSCRDRDWVVLFLGADFDNTAQARGYGAVAGTSAVVATGNMRDAMSFASAKRGTYSSSSGFNTAETMAYTTGEVESLAKPSS